MISRDVMTSYVGWFMPQSTEHYSEEPPKQALPASLASFAYHIHSLTIVLALTGPTIRVTGAFTASAGAPFFIFISSGG